MKRICIYEFGGPEVLKIEEADDPRPRADEVLIRIKAAGVNPYDTYMRSGNYGARTPTLPFTPGSDAAGVVEAVGADVGDITPGNRVYTTGTLTGAYAELALCKRSQVHPLPERISFAQGAGIFVPYATAYRALFQIARATALETVLIHGASGGVGLAAVQFARTAGLSIIGTAGTGEGLQLIRQQGVHHAINHRAPDYGQDILRAIKPAERKENYGVQSTPEKRDMKTDPQSHPYATHLDIKFDQLSLVDVPVLIAACKDRWYNQTLCKVNASVVRLGVMQGEYHWHKHDNDDEFFFVLEGTFFVDLEDRVVELKAWQGFTVPKGVVHRTRAPERAVIIMIENASIVPTGD